MSYRIRLHANRVEAPRYTLAGGEEVEEELRDKRVGGGGRGRFYSALRPELDLRSSTRMGDAELAGQSHPCSSLVYRCPSPNAFLLLHTRCTVYALWQRCARVASVTLWPHDVSQCATDQKTSTNTPRDRIREIQREGKRRLWWRVKELSYLISCRWNVCCWTVVSIWCFEVWMRSGYGLILRIFMTCMVMMMIWRCLLKVWTLYLRYEELDVD